MIPNSIVKCWKKCLFFGLKVAQKILIKGSAKMKSTSTPPTNELPKTLGQWVVASFEVEQSITTGNQAPRLRHATHHLCTRPTSPPQLSLPLSLSLFLSTETPLWPTPCAHTHFFTFTFASSCDQSPLCPITLDSTAVSIFVVILVELTNTVFVNSTNITTNIETAVLSTPEAHRLE